MNDPGDHNIQYIEIFKRGFQVIICAPLAPHTCRQTGDVVGQLTYGIVEPICQTQIVLEETTAGYSSRVYHGVVRSVVFI